MDITPLVSLDLKLVRSYQAGRFNINGEIFDYPVIICGNRVERWTEPQITIGVQLENLAGDIDVLLIGAGEKFTVLPPEKRAAFFGLGFSVDVMDTPAACRTFNVLTSEGRRVAAALMTI